MPTKSTTQMPTESTAQTTTVPSTQTPTESSTQTSTEPPTENPPTSDSNLYADAATIMNAKLFLFKNGLFRIGESADVHPVKDTWPGGPSNIDAAFAANEKNTMITYFFQGSQYWRFTGNVSDSGNPQPISGFGFPSSVEKIDAALSENGKITMFFVGNQLWSYRIGEGMDNRSPIPISTAFEENNPVDAALKYNGNVYLISGSTVSKYSRMQD
ncbi:matrix metalloproteinase-20-like [Rhinoraja longicauda]